MLETNSQTSECKKLKETAIEDGVARSRVDRLEREIAKFKRQIAA